MPTKHSLKTNLYEQNIWKDIFQKIFNRIVYQKNSINIFGQKIFKRSLYQKVSRDIFLAKRIWKNEQRICEETFSTKKSESMMNPTKKSKT